MPKQFAPDCLGDDVGTYKIEDIFIGNTIQYAYDFSSVSKEDTSIFDMYIDEFKDVINNKNKELLDFELSHNFFNATEEQVSSIIRYIYLV